MEGSNTVRGLPIDSIHRKDCFFMMVKIRELSVHLCGNFYKLTALPVRGGSPLLGYQGLGAMQLPNLDL